MALENKAFRFFRNTGPARFLLPLAAILIIMGVIITFFSPKDFVETTATVTSVEILPSSESDSTYTVHLTYTVDGREYEGEIGSAESYVEGETVKIFYDPDDPENISQSGDSTIIGVIMLIVGAALIPVSIYITVKAFKKDKEVEAKTAEIKNNADFIYRPKNDELTEYYFRYDNQMLKPGYLIEDKDRNVIFEGKMLQNAMIGDRKFLFVDHTNMRQTEHKVGHTLTQSYNNEFFSKTSYFKIDGVNIWDLLHSRGIRIETDHVSKFPKCVYTASIGGEFMATIETSSVYVHEEDEANHKLSVPMGSRYYRFWTSELDFESLFLIMFALSETEQNVAD